MSKSFILAIVTVLLGAVSAGAQSMPPAPAPELAAFMKDLLGSWTCATTFAPGAFGNAEELKTRSKIKFSKDPALGGFFYRGEYSTAKAQGLPAAMRGVLQLTYDAALKLAVGIGADDMGGASMGTGPLSETSVSWSGDSYVAGSKLKFRETFTKTGPKQFTNTFEVDLGHGYQKMGENVCTR